METIDKLRKYTKRLLILSLVSTALMMILHVADFYLSWLNTELINTDLIHTIIASFYAVTIAVWIYREQQEDKYQNVKNTLISFLEYLDEKLSEETFHDLSPTHKEITAVPINQDLINGILNSGNFNNVIDDLIKLQGFIELYNFSTNHFVTLLGSKKSKVKILFLIRDAQNLIQERASKILHTLNKSY